MENSIILAFCSDMVLWNEHIIQRTWWLRGIGRNIPFGHSNVQQGRSDIRDFTKAERDESLTMDAEKPSLRSLSTMLVSGRDNSSASLLMSTFKRSCRQIQISNFSIFQGAPVRSRPLVTDEHREINCFNRI
jgi:hypothetical protein